MNDFNFPKTDVKILGSHISSISASYEVLCLSLYTLDDAVITRTFCIDISWNQLGCCYKNLDRNMSSIKSFEIFISRIITYPPLYQCLFSIWIDKIVGIACERAHAHSSAEPYCNTGICLVFVIFCANKKLGIMCHQSQIQRQYSLNLFAR